MSENPIAYFLLLKDRVESNYKLYYPRCEKKINDWTGTDISNFQEDLRNKVNAHISEKWFYTHIKPLNNEKLPRIDILDLLSQYTGYKNWNNFVEKNQEEAKIYSIKNVKNRKSGTKSDRRKVFHGKRLYVLVAVIVVIIAIVVISINQINQNSTSNENYMFCFVDADLGKPILNNNIEITILNENESPITTQCNDGCFEISSEQEEITFLVSAQYYKTDTISRVLDKKERKEMIKLRTDDYALMIHLFSKTGIEGWEKRRKQLYEMLSDDVQVFQIDENNIGMEMYNKSEFIDKLTTPLKSLDGIDVLETQYDGGKIRMIRFVQVEKKTKK